MDLQALQDWSSILANLAAVLGVPTAVIVFVRDRRQARRAREEETYRAMQEQYADFLRLCIERPDLGLHDYRRELPTGLTESQARQRMAALELLVSMFESAYFLYERGHHSEFRRRQWSGWNEYMLEWARRDDFREAWQEHLGSQFDQAFLDHMNGLIRRSA